MCGCNKGRSIRSEEITSLSPEGPVKFRMAASLLRETLTNHPQLIPPGEDWTAIVHALQLLATSYEIALAKGAA